MPLDVIARSAREQAIHRRLVIPDGASGPARRSDAPRWIWWGTAICGIPSEVSRAMLRGWHANNGVVLGNPRLGFVCTGQTVDGQPGLEGYYRDWDHDLAPDERLQFSPGERSPAFDPDRAPKLPQNTWPEERLRKVLRNYAMEYITSIVPETIATLGPEEGGHLAGAAARLIGMHTFDEVASLLGGVEPGAVGFAKAFARLAIGLVLAIQQWRTEVSGALLKQGRDAALGTAALLSSSRLGHHSHMARISAV